MVVLETKFVSYDQALTNSLEMINIHALVQEEHGFQKGTQWALWATGSS